ncbi:aminotransferase class V-fold PLP-dependent enzyme [Pedobacter arcticus]|uniref:aminotransferase class V-fold PLP-dependent enzyme n=1 Tax=Pedobacter arcticus TaxID=752140 RepID=UPI00031952A2|nr:aminotransferase class V-fold PLP-dependent enzyme [Pedobacter arcticus]
MNDQEKLKELFLLDKNICFLNFGSFGACPKPIFEEYLRWAYELEKEPVQFLVNNAPKLIETARIALSEYVNCHHDDLVIVTNPSYAINMVVKSLALKAGDEILATNLEYGACDRVWEYYTQKVGAKYVRQQITLPFYSKADFVENFFEGLTDKTKFVYLSHITSATALILPIKEICAIARSKGLITIIDGAHAPGHIPLDLIDLQADIYTGACHKWMMTAKGSSFLYVRKDLQHLFDPLVISWGYKSTTPSHSQFIDYHQLQGTRDFSAFLTIPKAIEFMQENKWTQVAKNCREITHANASRFCELFDTKPLAPINDEFMGQMFSTKIKCSQPDVLQQHLFQKYNIEVLISKNESDLFVRYSINAFNSQADLDKLFVALSEIKEKGVLLS